MLGFVLYVQTHTGGFEIMTADQFRTILMTFITGLLGYSSRVLYCLRDDVRDLKKEVKGDDGKGGMTADINRLRKDADWLLRRRWEQDEAERVRSDLKRRALAEAERDQYDGPDRRHDVRRDRDRLADTYENPIEGESHT